MIWMVSKHTHTCHIYHTILIFIIGSFVASRVSIGARRSSENIGVMLSVICSGLFFNLLDVGNDVMLMATATVANCELQ